MKKIDFIPRDLPYEINEEIKQLRTNIKFCGDDKRVIMLTSSISGEGKSTIAIDLANSFHDLGERVLLIDTDMRKSMMKHYVKEKEHIQYGLSHLLTGQCKLNDALYKTDMGTYAIFAGPTPPNPSELLSNDRMKKMMETLRGYFDYIIVDCPPLGAVVDAAVISMLCDGVIVVVEAGKVPYKVAQGVIRQMNNTSCQVLGTVLNKVDIKKKGRYYKSYYYKKYGYYAEHDDAKAGVNDDSDLESIDIDDI